MNLNFVLYNANYTDSKFQNITPIFRFILYICFCEYYHSIFAGKYNHTPELLSAIYTIAQLHSAYGNWSWKTERQILSS